MYNNVMSCAAGINTCIQKFNQSSTSHDFCETINYQRHQARLHVSVFILPIHNLISQFC